VTEGWQSWTYKRDTTILADNLGLIRDTTILADNLGLIREILLY
jgi:hypothetical protein